MEDWVPGTRVRLKGLGTRADLNGAIAVVLEPANEAEATGLKSKGRIKVRRIDI